MFLKLKMSRSRYTIHSTLLEINIWKEKLLISIFIEASSQDQMISTLSDIKSNYGDEWDWYRQHKAIKNKQGDIKYYNKCIRKRMKIEKTLKLLNIRLSKLQNVLLSTNSYKLFVINCIDIHPDVLFVIKTWMLIMFDQKLMYF